MKTIILDQSNIGEFYTSKKPTLFKVYKVYRNSNKSKTIKTNLTELEAQSLVMSYPNSDFSMIVYTKQ